MQSKCTVAAWESIPWYVNKLFCNSITMHVRNGISRMHCIAHYCDLCVCMYVCVIDMILLPFAEIWQTSYKTLRWCLSLIMSEKKMHTVPMKCQIRSTRIEIICLLVVVSDDKNAPFWHLSGQHRDICNVCRIERQRMRKEHLFRENIVSFWGALIAS